jgi:hypothetical protein
MSKKPKQIISDDELTGSQAKNQTPVVYLKGSKRLLASFLHMLIMLCLGLVFDKFIISPIVKNATGYTAISEKYKAEEDEYKKLQDQYGVYIYTESSQRVQNPSFSEENSASFYNDPRVKELTVSLQETENKSLTTDIAILAIDYLSATLIYALGGNFLFGIGRSFPNFILHYELVDNNDKKLRVGGVFKFALGKWFFNAILGLITLGILPIYNYYYLVHDENYQCPIDKLLKVRYKLSVKYSSDK